YLAVLLVKKDFRFFSLLFRSAAVRMVMGGSAVVVRLLASCPSSALGGRGKTRAAGSRSSSPYQRKLVFNLHFPLITV
ncbi:MAG: hypothetical protein SOX11_13565, partial [Lachnospiraceae bacterium]|nr:hypothetical protein [Lachnospiraceae bacterium]